ncbi:hypothetical protein [Candidatus Nanohalovita haloferacivicina]|uniref:hypothetical protein n=1 Tax=Candidatus Nanohalovita haloferacivicina TaxID=2978046 RepID=UPI00325FAEA7|nr:hypothetical protein HBNXNv_1078 [Candidatus Nanohalobia archaeon BNXNv]
MLRKGALEAGLGEIMLTVLVAAVISGAMFGPLGAKVGEGFREAERFTNVNTTVVVDDKETFGELLKYNYWRAWSCDDIEGETFSDLRSTSLTDDGAVPCAGAGSTLAKGAQELYSSSGNDMEGKYGRIKFKINSSISPFRLKTGLAFGSNSAATLAGVSTGDGPNGKAGYSDWLFGPGCADWKPVVGDGYASQAVTQNGQKIINKKPYSFFTLFFKNGGGSSRVNTEGGGRTIEQRYQDGGENDGLYCDEYNDGPWLTKPGEENGFPKDENSVTNNGQDHYVEVLICPGDEGYIETRKGSPHNAGEASGDMLGVLSTGDNEDNLYGMIQITDMNSSCTLSNNPTPNQRIINQLTSPPDSYNFNNDRVLYEESGTNVFRPDDSYGDDQMVWNLPSGQKRIEFDVYFETRGHFRIDVIDSSNDRVTNINTDATGTDELWMYCRTCNENNDPPYQHPGDTAGDSYGVVANYQTGEEYTIVLRKTGTNVEWEMTDSSGNVVWEHSKNMNGDFNRVELEAWESWASGTTEDAVIRINDIRIN